MDGSEAATRGAGTLLRRRERQPWPEDRDFRILSIDGGGIKGVLPATVLAALEHRYCDGNIGAYFDLVAGTSTGGIIALGLGMGLSAREVSQLYIEHGRDVFPLPGFPRGLTIPGRWLRSWFVPARGRHGLERMVRTTFGQRKLRESRLRLCIPTVDAERGGEIFVFKTPHHPHYRKDWDRTFATAALATSAAPAYLPPFVDEMNEFLDGGLWALNPILVAVVEALTAFDVSPERVRVLSLGCVGGSYRLSWGQRKMGGKLLWAGNVIDGMMHFQTQAALGQAGLLIGRDRILRLASPPLGKMVAMDDWEGARQRLPGIGERLAVENGGRIRDLFLYDKALPYEPVYTPDRSPSPVSHVAA